MSEFSDKLSEYIAKSGSNVYQLAKEASLDRTTLQKTAKGQRLPSLDYIREICQYIKISSKQEEELVRLYKIEKLGHSTVKAWDEIQQIILDIYQLRKNEKSTWHIRFDEVSLKSFNAQIVQKCDSEMDCLKAIMCVMEQELEDPDHAEIYMDVSWASKLVLCQLRQSEGNKSEKLTCHQLVNLKQTEHVKDGMLENIQILHQVLPYAFTTHQKHIPIVLQSIPQTPDRTSYILDHIQKNPLPQMVEAGKRLKEAGAAYLAIPCVTAHYFYRELCRQIDLPIISLLEKTADYFRTEGVDEVAILATSGTVMCKIIQQELGKKHIQTLLPDERQQQKIMEIIYKQIKAGRSVEIEEFEQIGTQLQQRGAQKLLLGCTELSLLKRDFTLNQAYADVLEILASAVVTYNGLPVKEYHRQTQEIK